MRLLALLVVSMFFAFGCSDRPHLTFDQTLTVRIVSDYAPGAHATQAEVDVFDGSLDESSTRLAHYDRRILASDDLAGGIVAASVTPVAAGLRSVRGELRDARGELLGARVVEFEMPAESHTVTIFISARCAGVICQGSDGLSACVNGRCVDPRCTPDSPAHCPTDLFCSAPGDCSSPSECAEVLCEDGICLDSPLENACETGEYCSHEDGCVGTTPATDGGTEGDLCGRICTLPEAPCLFGYYACDDGGMTCTPFVQVPVGTACGNGNVCDETATCVPAMDGGVAIDASVDAGRDASVRDAGIRDASIRDATAVCITRFDDGAIGPCPDATIEVDATMEPDAGVDCESADVVVEIEADLIPYLGCRRLRSLRVTPWGTVETISLPNLESIGRIDLSNFANTLRTVSWPNLVEVDGEYRVVNNTSLTTLDLANVERIGFLSVGNDSVLTSIDAPNLESAEISIYCGGASAITSIDLSALTTANFTLPRVDGWHANGVQIIECDRVTTVDLGALETVEGPFVVVWNNRLEDLSVGALAAVGEISISNPLMTSLDFPELLSTTTNFSVQEQPLMTSLTAPKLATVGGTFVLQRDDALVSLTLPSLTTLGSGTDWDTFEIWNNAMLASVSVPELVSIDGDLTLNLSSALSTFQAPKLTSVSQDVTMSNTALTSSPFTALESIGGNLVVQNNRELLRFTPAALESVGGFITVNNNDLVCPVTFSPTISIGDVAGSTIQSSC